MEKEEGGGREGGEEGRERQREVVQYIEHPICCTLIYTNKPILACDYVDSVPDCYNLIPQLWSLYFP